MRSDPEASLGRRFCSLRDRRFSVVSESMLTDRDRLRCVGEMLRLRSACKFSVPGFSTENPEFTSLSTSESGPPAEKLELDRRIRGRGSYDPSDDADWGSPKLMLGFSDEGVVKGLDLCELEDPGGVDKSDELRGKEKLTISPETIGG